jgi:uncharacterized membrane protein YfcA
LADQRKAADNDSERKPSGKEREERLSGTTYDLVLVLLALGTAGFAFGAIASAIERQYPFTVVYAVLAVVLAYLYYYLRRNGRRSIGQDFYL